MRCPPRRSCVDQTVRLAAGNRETNVAEYGCGLGMQLIGMWRLAVVKT